MKELADNDNFIAERALTVGSALANTQGFVNGLVRANRDRTAQSFRACYLQTSLRHAPRTGTCADAIFKDAARKLFVCDQICTFVRRNSGVIPQLDPVQPNHSKGSPTPLVATIRLSISPPA